MDWDWNQRTKSTSVPGPSRWDGDEDPGKIHFIVPKFWEKNRMRSETQPYSTVLQSLIAIRLCRTAHAIFSPKFWNDKTNFTRVFVTVSPRRPWDRGWNEISNTERGQTLRACIRFQTSRPIVNVNFIQGSVECGQSKEECTRKYKVRNSWESSHVLKDLFSDFTLPAALKWVK